MDQYQKSLIKACIIVTNKVFIHSPIRDAHLTGRERMDSRRIESRLDFIGFMREYTQPHMFAKSDPYKMLVSSLKFSIANCDEFTILCAVLIQILIKQDPRLSNIDISQGVFSNANHGVLVLTMGTFFHHTRYIVDPWSLVTFIEDRSDKSVMYEDEIYDYIVALESDYIRHVNENPREFLQPPKMTDSIFGSIPFEIERGRELHLKSNYRKYFELVNHFGIVKLLEHEIRLVLANSSYTLRY